MYCTSAANMASRFLPDRNVSYSMTSLMMGFTNQNAPLKKPDQNWLNTITHTDTP